MSSIKIAICAEGYCTLKPHENQKKNAFWLAFNLNCGIPFKLMNSQQTQKNAKISNPPASFFYMTHEFFSVHIHSTNKNQNKNALVGSFIKCPEINSI